LDYPVINGGITARVDKDVCDVIADGKAGVWGVDSLLAVGTRRSLSCGDMAHN
jgi:hypothetical protein